MDPKGAADAWNRRAALAAEKVAAEPVAIYQAKGSSEYLWNDVSRAEFARTDPALRRIVYAAPQQPAQSAEQDERAQLDVSMLARLSAQIFDCPLNPTISKFARAVEANVRAASTQATRHARKAISDLFAQETNNG
jgi:hypothetical protein